MKKSITALLAIGVLIPCCLGAQSIAFDAVSVKLNKSGDSTASIGWRPGGRWGMVNVSTAGLIHSAYPTKVEELVGAPAWVTVDRYDVDARATFEPTTEQKQTMLRAFLADRFNMAAHLETQLRPVYNLVVARADGRLGPKIRRIDIDCATYKRQPPEPGAASPFSADPPPCGYSMQGDTTLSIVSGGRSMQALGDSLSGELGRPVVDKTGLTGYYAYTLEAAGDDHGVSVFTAVQEQLGLKLEPARGPVDILVIDHIERPTEN